MFNKHVTRFHSAKVQQRKNHPNNIALTPSTNKRTFSYRLSETSEQFHNGNIFASDPKN